ncbi:sensor histidine kinase [Carboxylicivirga caseinilyticus]|uniref:sensor histidine kinase n=1 Tax=Carboxylicivirga caseinilyticus TaxID=3417572 RepID=UPI003D34EB94|nr:hypothetical protein [Marinilabiliaceae bacterium A049]
MNTSLFRLLLIPIILSLISTGCSTENNDQPLMPVNLTEELKSVSLNGHYQIYSSIHDHSVSEIADSFNCTYLGKPGYNEYLWICFTIKNSTNKNNVILEINNNYLHKYELYQLVSDSIGLLAKGGIAYPFHWRNIDNRRFIENLSIESDSTRSYILKIDDRERETSLSLRVWNKQAFNKNEAKDLLFYNLYFGGLVFIAMFSLLIGLILRMKAFFAYSFYTLIMVWFMFDNLGFAYEFFYPNQPFIKRFLDTSLIAPLLFSFVHFGATYFKIPEKHPTLFKLIKVYYWSILLYLLFWVISGAQLTMHYYLLANYTFVFLTFSIQISIVVLGIKYQRIKAYFFMSAVFVLLVGAILFALSYAGHIPYEWFPTNPLLIGSVIEFGIFSIALLYEVHQINKTKNDLLIANAEHQKNLLAAYVEGTEKERARLSAELHDNVGSRLALLKHKINKAADNSEVTDDLDSLYKNVRSMSHELSPHEFEIINLHEYLQNYLDDFEKSTSVKVIPYFKDLHQNLNPEITHQVFRIIQEALLNIQKHADASCIEIQLITHDNELILTIDDNGKGFDPYAVNSNKSNGLFNMKTRVQALDGTFEISSQPNKGTHILVAIPFKKK